MSYVDEVIEQVVKQNPAEPEFHQAVRTTSDPARLPPSTVPARAGGSRGPPSATSTRLFRAKVRTLRRPES